MQNELKRIIFCTDIGMQIISEQEMEEAEKELVNFEIIRKKFSSRDREEDIISSICEYDQTGSLYLADTERVFCILKENGYPAAVYMHKGNEKCSFMDADYIISEPQWVDDDSYEKIYERLAQIPWTILETPRCIIREMTADDVEPLYRLYDEEALRYMEGLKQDHSEERELISEYVRKVYGLYGYGYWAAILKETGELIGRVGFEPYRGSDRYVSLGYLIRDDCRNQGLAFEITKAAVKYAKTYLGFPGICAYINKDNTASLALVKKLGFTEEEPFQDEGHGFGHDNACGDDVKMYVLK